MNRISKHETPNSVDARSVRSWIRLGATVRDEFRGLRVSPNIYTTLDELDRFCAAVEQVIRKGTL